MALPLLKDYYALLNVKPTASSEEVARACGLLKLYRDAPVTRHYELRSAIVDALSEAVDVLSDEQQRAAYDKARAILVQAEQRAAKQMTRTGLAGFTLLLATLVACLAAYEVAPEHGGQISALILLVFFAITLVKRARESDGPEVAPMPRTRESVNACGANMGAMRYVCKMCAREERQQAIARGGLVILNAVFGDTDVYEEERDMMEDRAEHWRSAFGDGEVEDWEDEIQDNAAYVKDTLYVPGTFGKEYMVGFLQPLGKGPRVLDVLYAFEGKMHAVVVDTHDELAIPNKDHRIG